MAFNLFALVAALPLFAMAEPLSWGKALVLPAPAGFSYSVVEVAFQEPRYISSGAGVISRLRAVKVLVRGKDFRPKATGPIIWLNSIPTLRTRVTEDGTAIEAYFFESFRALEEAATRLGKWELIYQSHEGTLEVCRVSPTGDPHDADRRPVVGFSSE